MPYAFELVGGRNDGDTISVDQEHYRETVLLVVQDTPPPSKGGSPVVLASGLEVFLYRTADMEGPIGNYDGPGVYHRCSDDLFRTAKAKSVLGL